MLSLSIVLTIIADTATHTARLLIDGRVKVTNFRVIITVASYKKLKSTVIYSDDVQMRCN